MSSWSTSKAPSGVTEDRGGEHGGGMGLKRVRVGAVGPKAGFTARRGRFPLVHAARGVLAKLLRSKHEVGMVKFEFLSEFNVALRSEGSMGTFGYILSN